MSGDWEWDDFWLWKIKIYPIQNLIVQRSANEPRSTDVGFWSKNGPKLSKKPRTVSFWFLRSAKTVKDVQNQSSEQKIAQKCTGVRVLAPDPLCMRRMFHHAVHNFSVCSQTCSCVCWYPQGLGSGLAFDLWFDFEFKFWVKDSVGCFRRFAAYM